MAHFAAVLSRARSHLTRNVVAYLALFVALGGTSYGLAAGSIDSREIKNDTIRTRDLRNNEVRSRDIRNRTIVGRDLLSNSLGGDQIDEQELGEVPLATRSKSADDALALGGEAPSAFAHPPLALTADVPDANSETDLLQVPGFGLLRAGASACNTGAGSESFSLRYVNTTAASIEAFALRGTGGTTHTTVPANGTVTVADDDQESYIVLRLIPADGAPNAVTATLFSNNQGTSCRVSLQVLVSA